MEKFDTKIAVLLRDDLAVWQRLNVTAFLVSGIAGPEVVGEPYEDADGVRYLPMFRQPVMVFEGSKEFMATAHERALSREIEHSVFTQDLFATGNDHDNRAAVKAVRTAELDLVGIAFYGPKNAVDKPSRAPPSTTEQVPLGRAARSGCAGTRLVHLDRWCQAAG